MKILFKTEQLLNKLKNLSPTAEAKQTLMILGNAAFKIKDNIAEVTTTDLEIEVSTKIECDSDTDTSFTIPAKKLQEVVAALSNHNDVEFHIKNNAVDIIAGKSKISLPTLSIDDFPLNETSSDTFSEIDCESLLNLIDKTSFAMAYQDARHFLNGMHLCNESNKIVSVCTDGHRLAKHTSNISISDDLSLILPRKAVNEISRVMSSFNNIKDVLAEFSFNNNTFMIKINDFLIKTKLIEGDYPNFNKVIPQQADNVIEIDKSLFKNSLNVISKVVNQQYKGVKLTPNPNGTLHLISSNTESEIGEDHIDANYTGIDISVGFNINYLQDVINVLSGDKVFICINDQNSGCIVKDADSTSSTYVIMPMRV